jgi:L-iditol 2-dehydrogenase
MRTVRLHGPGRLRLADEATPHVPPGFAPVAITTVGICGSDLHWYLTGGIGDAQLDRPIVPGHELAGVVDVGDGTEQRVAVDPAIPCGTCPICGVGDANLCPQVAFAGHSRDGGLQEQLVWPRALLHPLPDGVSDLAGAMLEPLGVALHAADLGHLRIGMRVLVVGCGPIGLLLVQLARLAGAAQVVGVEPIAHRREAARRFGADLAVAGSQELAEEGQTGFDVAFEVTDDGLAAETAMGSVRPGARVVLVGIPDDDRTSFSASLARRKGLTLVLSRRMHGTYPRAIDLVATGRVDVASLVSHRFGLEQAAEAFTVAAERQGLKTVVHPDRPTVG